MLTFTLYRHARSFRSLTFSSQDYFQTLLNLIHSDYMIPALQSTAQTHTSQWTAKLLAGLVTSADTGNEDLVIASRAAVTDFCSPSSAEEEYDKKKKDENLDLVCGALVQNLESHQGVDRIIVPTLEMVAFLFHVGLFQRCCGGGKVNLRRLCLQAQKAGFKTGNVRKIEACVKVYGGVATCSNSGNGGSTSNRDGGHVTTTATTRTAGDAGTEAGVREARKRLGALLFHPWPKVRTIVVDELWNLVGEELEVSRERLLGVDWGVAQKAQIRSVVEELRLE